MNATYKKTKTSKKIANHDEENVVVGDVNATCNVGPFERMQDEAIKAQRGRAQAQGASLTARAAADGADRDIN